MSMKTLFAVILLLASASFAPAQEAPILEARTAFGASHYLHGDLGYTAPTWLVALRIGHAGVAVEPEFVLASHEETQVFNASTSTTSRSTIREAGVCCRALPAWR